MASSQPYPEVKRIGETGQVSVGKSLAGKLVRVEPGPEGVLLRFVVDVPEKEAWWTREPYKSDLVAALAWAKANPPQETDLDALITLVREQARKKRPAVRARKGSKTSQGVDAGTPTARSAEGGPPKVGARRAAGRAR